MRKRGQQEIAGFVIIVALVIVAIFVFIIMYFANKKDNLQSKEVEALLISMMKVSTECYFDGEVPANLEEVLIDAYESIPRRCKNNGETSTKYLEEYFPKLMDKVLSLETNFEGYVFEVVDKNTNTIIKTFSKNECKGKETRGADFLLGRDLQVFLRIC